MIRSQPLPLPRWFLWSD